MPNEIYVRMEKLRAGKLTKSQRRLIEYFTTADLRCVAYLSITEVAQRTDVAEATVLRFCRALGFDRYQQFRIALTEENSGSVALLADRGYLDELEEGYRTALVQCRKQLTEVLLTQACTMIATADFVCCFGTGDSYFTAVEFHRRLMTMGILTYCERDFRVQNILLSSCEAGDLLILFAGTEEKDAVEIAELARANGMQILLISCGVLPQAKRFADVFLAVSDMEGAVQKYGASRCAESFAADALLAGVYNFDRGRYEAALARSRRASAQR